MSLTPSGLHILETQLKQLESLKDNLDPQEGGGRLESAAGVFQT